MGSISLYDWIVFILLTYLIVFFTKKYLKKHSSDFLVQKYFKTGLYLKIIGSLAFALFHNYVVKGGDTFGYYVTGMDILKQLMINPINYFRLVFSSFESITDLRLNIAWSWGDDIMWLGESNFFTPRIVALAAPLGLGSYLGIGLVFAVLSYWGIWKAFKIFCRLYPTHHLAVALSFLYFPTVIFWGSSISKDTLALACICGFTNYAYEVFVFKKYKILNITIMLLLGYLVFLVKAYILFAFLPALVFAVQLKRVVDMKNLGLKIILIPTVLVFLAIILYFSLSYIGANFTKFNPEFLTQFIVNSNVNLQAANSKFDLGIKPENITGIGDLIPFFPKAVVASWFRPWIWEVRSPATLLSTIESMIILYLFIYIFIKGYIFKTIAMIVKDPILFSSIVYAFIFSGLVGLSTSNFGTLVRYKLPAMPFLGITLLIIYTTLREKNKPLH